MPRIPKVSVVMATYNHAPFVTHALESVLRQSFDDFEFLIADDGSSDATADLVSQVTDPRMTFEAHPANRGACTVLSELIERAAGEYVAVMNSDDLWSSDKLAWQVDFLDRHTEYAALFGRASFIDETGAPIPARIVPFGDVFDQDNRSQGQWLRQFFARGNCLCHPTLLIRRPCYSEIGLYDNRLRQLPDLDMWIRLAKTHRFFVANRPFVSLRVLGNQNASSYSPDNMVRTSSEHFLIGWSFFDGMAHELLLEGFSDWMVFTQPPSEVHWDIEKTLLYLAPAPSVVRMYQVIGLIRLFALRRSSEHQAVLENDYQFDDQTFHELSANIHAFRPPPRGWNRVEELVRRARARIGRLAGGRG